MIKTGTVMKPLCFLLSQEPQRMMTMTAMVKAQLAMMRTKRKISFCRVVRPGASPVDSLAIRPLDDPNVSEICSACASGTHKTVESPV